jgi:peptidoglycan/LPS O-acetylase OafA/YrhL
MRGVAALLVVIAHSVDNFREVGGVRTHSALADAVGVLAVNSFFVISGFLMVYVHGGDFGEPRATRNYYARRMTRILPLYWTITLVYGLKEICFGEATWWDAARSLLFVPYQNETGLWQPVVHQGWTLNYEMIFYIVFGLSLFFAWGVWIVFATFGALAAIHFLGFSDSLGPLAFWSKPIILYFLVGVALGLLRRRISRGPSFATAGILSLIVVFAFALSGAQLHSGPYFLALGLPTASIIAVSVVAMARESTDRSRTRRLADLLGNISYSVYLTHLLVIAPAAKIGVARMFPHMPLAVFLLLMLCATAVAGYIVYKFVERPLIKLWNRVFISSSRSVTTTPAAT